MSTPITNPTIDSVAHRISMGMTTAEVRDYLLALGLTEYSAYLCFKAAQLLLAGGYYTKGTPTSVRGT